VTGVIWRNMGLDQHPEHTTVYDHCAFEDLKYDGTVFLSNALLRAWRGPGAIVRNSSFRVHGATQAVYLNGTSDQQRAVFEHCTVEHLSPTTPSAVVSTFTWVKMNDVRFLERGAMPAGRYITASNVAVGPFVIVDGPNVHWASAGGPIGLIPPTTAGGAIAAKSVLYMNAAGAMSGAAAGLSYDEATGFVGVGTATPSRIMDVRATGTTGPGFATVNSGTAVTNGTGVILSNTSPTTNNWVGIGFADSTGGAASANIAVRLTDRTNHYGEFGIATRDSDAYVERMRINRTGVGISGSSALLPTARLHLPAGVATANSAPIKLTSSAGVLMTVPENGAIEFDGTHLWITIGGVRKQLDN
jgi:hypothetical protein